MACLGPVVHFRPGQSSSKLRSLQQQMSENIPTLAAATDVDSTEIYVSPTLRLADICISSDTYRPSRTLDLLIDNYQRTAVFQSRKTFHELRWAVRPPVVISSSSLLSVQPYEARSLLSALARRKVESVTILGDTILQACTKGSGDKYEYIQSGDGFRVTLGILVQKNIPEDAKSGTLSKSEGLSALSPARQASEPFYGPHPAPNVFKQSSDILVSMQSAFHPQMKDPVGEALAALEHVNKAMPAGGLDEDLQELCERMLESLTYLAQPEFSSRLRLESKTIDAYLTLIKNTALFSEDYMRPEAKTKVSMLESRQGLLQKANMWYGRLRRNFEAHKNSSPDVVFYVRTDVEATSRLDEVVADNASESGSFTGAEDDKISNLLSPLFIPNDLAISRCMEGTRDAILQEALAWLNDEEAPNVLWICGAPGSGKTALSWSLVSEIESRQRNGCSFFCGRSNADPIHVWRTVAYNLTWFNPALKATISNVLSNLGENESPSSVPLAFEKLVAGPLKAHVAESIAKSPVVLIDGLDQCARREPETKEFLQTLASWLELPSKFKLIVTSRIEDDIFSTFDGKHLKKMELPLGDHADASADIHTYIQRRAAIIKKQDDSLPIRWPGSDQVATLVKHADGLFLWAAAAMDLVEKGPDPERQLSLLVAGGTTMKLDTVDAVYRGVLTLACPTGEPDLAFHAIMGAIAFAKSPLSLDDLRHLLPDRLATPVPSFDITKLRAVLTVTEGRKGLSITHKSFVDYLVDSKRCGKPFVIDRTQTNRKLAFACLKLMLNKPGGLMFNIAGIASSHSPNEVTPEANKTSNTPLVSTHLSYACRYWVEHLHDTTDRQDIELLSLLKVFFHTHLLHWLEVASINNILDQVPALLTMAANWLEPADPQLSSFAAEASRFALNFMDPMALSVPHIYLSAFPFLPKESTLAQQYQGQFSKTLRVVDEHGIRWPPLRSAFSTKTYIYSLALSPDGTRIAGGGSGNELQIWQIATGQLISSFAGHVGSITAVAFSRSGKWIISGSSDRTLGMWDVETRSLVHERLEEGGHTDWLRSVAMSNDETKIVSGSDDQTVRLWSFETGKQLFEPFRHKDWVRCVVFTSDDLRVISCSDDRTIRIWCAVKGTALLEPIMGSSGWIRAIAFSDGRVACGGDDAVVRVFDSNTGKEIMAPLHGHYSTIQSLAYSPDGKLLLSAGSDKTIRVWNTETGDQFCEPLLGHTATVTSVLFTPDGRYIISGGDEGSVKTWDLAALQTASRGNSLYRSARFLDAGAIFVALDHTSIRTAGLETRVTKSVTFAAEASPRITAAALSNDGSLAAVSDEKGVSVWDAVSGRRLHGPLQGHTDTVFAITFSQDSRKIATSGDDRTIRIWDAKDGVSICGPLEGHTGSVRSLSFSGSGKLVLSGSDDYSSRLWNAETGELVRENRAHKDWVRCVCMSSDDKIYATGSDDRSIIVYSVETGEPIYRPSTERTCETYVRALSISPDSDLIAHALFDNTVAVWDIKTGHIVCGPLYGHVEEICSLSFSSDSRKVISLSIDGTIRVWDISSPNAWYTSFDGESIASGGDDANVIVRNIVTGKELFPVLQGHSDWIRALSFSSDGELLASCSDDGSIRIWNARTGESTLGPIKQQTGSVRSVSFARDSRILAFGGEDKTVRICDLASSNPTESTQTFLGHKAGVNSVAFNVAGTRVVSGTSQGEIAVWDLTIAGAAVLPFEGHKGPISSVAFTPDSTQVVSAGEASVKIWEAASGNALTSLVEVSIGQINSIAVSPDGKRIIAGGQDSTVRILGIKTGAALAMPLRGHAGAVLSVAVSPDGRRIASSSSDEKVVVWNVDLNQSTTWPQSFERSLYDVEYCAMDNDGFFGERATFNNDSDGWVRGPNKELMFWVPPIYRKGLRTPGTLDTMGASQTIIDLRDFVHGKAWTQCKA
ncbi:WD40 repeat-like protein [Artomyces pyxidatus]|uniref:WD40 repeat-like protein n=1 Tax=Artomyces pyxidatus TaxID=48021 RepID=A0ACB8SKD6_9AGAM|nr:WD40 repeat-like protein [Artomyces pyxidatus]